MKKKTKEKERKTKQTIKRNKKKLLHHSNCATGPTTLDDVNDLFIHLGLDVDLILKIGLLVMKRIVIMCGPGRQLSITRQRNYVD